MKGFLVFFFATAIVSMSKADYKSVLDVHRGWNISNIPQSRVIRGTPANEGQIPYQIRLIMEFPIIVPLITAGCGGSIVASHWVLTAAHCIVFVSVAGIHIPYTSGTIEAGSVMAGSTSSQNRTVDSGGGHAHPMYNQQTLVNDIGLVYTAQAFVYSSNVQPITLVDSNPAANPNTYVNQDMFVSGFGYTTNDGPVSPVLLYTTLRGIPFSVCQEQIGSTLPQTSFCVQDPTPPISAICSGDSGGPGVLGGKQIGIVSYGSSEGCDTAGQGFTIVALFKDWIRLTTGLPL